jgi:cell division protein FtsI (penicillin-binding protein 3)
MRGNHKGRSSSAPAALRHRREVKFRQPAGAARRRRRAERRVAPARRVIAEKPPRQRRPAPFGLHRSDVRLKLVLVAIVLVLGLVLVEVAKIQIAGGERLRAAGADQWSRRVVLPADRGSIFDRHGEELAVSIPTYTISVNPKLVTDEAGVTATLQSILGLDDDEAADLQEALVAKESGFVYVRRQVDREVGLAIAGLELVGVNVDPEDRRVLPGGDTGRSVIGRTDIDGVGIAGLELQYDELLTGNPGELTREVAPRGRSIPGTEQVSSEPVPGSDMVLTIDRSIQFAAEELLKERVGELYAKSGYIIIMDTDSGDILAMASVQRNDADVVEVTSGNYAAVNAYEPGSVAKVVTIAAALNERVVTPESTFVVPWRKKFGDDLLRDSHQHPDEVMTVEQILVESSNIGTIMTQQALSPEWETARETHWDYLRSFGFGEPTELDFPDESPGILKDWSELWGSERVTVAYGQGFAATPIQMVSAVNTIANGGTYVAPRLVEAIVDPAGEVTRTEPSATHSVVRPQVAQQVQDMMRQVVCRGTAKRAQQGVEHFSIAGKTGTGLKAQPNGTYYNAAGERVYYASFAGFFPAEDPQITVVVSIDEPPAGDINRFGGTAAAPVFGKLVPTIVHELGIQPPPDTTPCGG